MAKSLVCDVCRKPTKRIVAKLFLSPKQGRGDHSNYTAHANVGECCGSRVVELVHWQKRVKQTSKSTAQKRQQPKPKDQSDAKE